MISTDGRWLKNGPKQGFNRPLAVNLSFVTLVRSSGISLRVFKNVSSRFASGSYSSGIDMLSKCSIGRVV